MSDPLPRAWAVAASYWGALESVPYMLRDEAEPLYDRAALDACVAAERERMNVHAVVLAETARQVERERWVKHLRDFAAGHQRAADMTTDTAIAERHDAMATALLAAAIRAQP